MICGTKEKEVLIRFRENNKRVKETEMLKDIKKQPVQKMLSDIVSLSIKSNNREILGLAIWAHEGVKKI